MKHFVKNILSITALLLLATNAWADKEFTYIYQLDGSGSSESAAGTVVGSISGNTATLTVTPKSGNYFETDGISVRKTIKGQYAQGRQHAPGYDEPVALTVSGTPDITGETKFTFDVTDEKYDYEVTVNFKSRTNIDGATITVDQTSFTYTGNEIKPNITKVNLTDGSELANTNYSVSYANNINVPVTGNDPQPTITVTGIGKYKGSASLNFTIAKADMVITANGFTGAYDGQAHGITVTAPEDAEVKYGTSEGTYDLDASPTHTDANTYTVYYKVTKDNYNDVTGSATVTINKAAGSISYAAATVNKTFGNAAFTNELTIVGDGTVGYTSDKESVATVDDNGNVTIVGNGEANITATVTDGTNYTYENKTASYKVNVGKADMVVTANGFTGAYDGQAHGITVTAPEDAEVKYGTSEGTYDLDASPTHTDANTYTVYYKVTKDNYNDVTGSATVTINKAAGSISYAAATVNKTFGNAAFTNELTIVGDGTVGYTSDKESVATVDDNGNVTIVGNGEANITATVTDGTNYTYENKTASYKVIVGKADMVVTANGFTGTYNGQAYGITVTAPDGATIAYGTTEGTYNLNASPTYTNAGTYPVYYEVTKDNYNDVTGSATVTINKAAGSISYAIAAVNKTFGNEAFTNELTIVGDGTVDYTSDKESVATVDANGEVTIVGDGEANITATVTDGTNYTYKTKTANYKLIVNRPQAQGYALWIGSIQVTSENQNDIFEDAEYDENGEISKSGSYTFNPTNNILFITDNQRHVDLEDPNAQEELLTIESRLPNLTIYLNGEVTSKLKSIVFNNEGNESNVGSLTFTCNGLQAGKLDVKNDEGKSAISGFKRINYELGLSIIDPEGTYLAGNELFKAEDDPKNPQFIPANIITIGTPMEVIDKTVPLDEKNLVQKDEEGNPIHNEDGTLKLVEDLSNTVIDNVVLITAPQSVDPNSDEGIDDSDGTPGIAFESTMTDEAVKEIADAVNNNEYLPGGQTFAENYSGVTIQLPPGEGYILATVMTEPGYTWHLSINGEDAIRLKEGVALISNFVDHGDGTIEVTISFDVNEPTFCYLYLVEDGAGVRPFNRIGKRERAHGKVTSIGVSLSKARECNPASVASGGVLPESEDPIIEVDETTGITNIIVDRPLTTNKWYDLQGRQIDQPTKAGLYIINRKKVIIK